MDMLVKLYDLPDNRSRAAGLSALGVRVRRGMAHERAVVTDWVARNFGAGAPGWVSEAGVAFSRVPATCFIATADGDVIGFCCYDCTCLGFIGPIGVADDWRTRGVGEALLLSALHAMQIAGYGYAIIGYVGSPGFFARAANAIEISGSDPGVYVDGLR